MARPVSGNSIFRMGSFIASLAVCLASLSLNSTTVHAQLYGIDGFSGDLYTISTVDASVSLVGNTGDFNGLIGNLFFNDRNGQLYGSTFGGVGPTKLMFAINPTDASSSLQYTLAADSSGHYEGGMAVSPDGVAYMGHWFGDELRVFDLETGQDIQASIDPTETDGNHDLSGMVWRDDGMIVAIDQQNYDNIVEIDPSTGDWTVLAQMPSDDGIAGGMTIFNDVGYFATTAGVGGFSDLYSIDLYTGEHELVGALPDGIGLTGLASISAAIPEPGSFVIIYAMLLAASLPRNRLV